MSPARLALVSLALALAAAPEAARSDVGPVVMADSTVLESWTLPNGLRVVTRHIPGCQNVDVTVAYATGSSDEPRGREGLGALLAELEFHAATAEAPERSRAEMASLRPSGWDVVVSPHVTRFSEIARADLLPGLVHGAADRMRGVTVTPSVLTGAIATVRADLDTACRLDLGLALHHAARRLAEGGGDSAIAREAAGRGLQGLGVRDVQQRLRATFVPSNAALAVAGNFRRVPLRALIESEFGSISAGAPQSRKPRAPLDSTNRVLRSPATDHAAGVVGVIVPALDDSTHPAFFMDLVLAGGHCGSEWGEPEAPLVTRFQYSIFDDPEMARFYPPVDSLETDPLGLEFQVYRTLKQLYGMTVRRSSYEAVWRGVDWLLGGPLSTDIFGRVLTEPGALHTLCSGMAVRELWGGERFWSKYRERFRQAIDVAYPEWFERMASAKHLVNLLFVPAR
ncbi:MAG TPA: hypothetical protein VGK89_05760 [Candidatus Eisenbacteria bacterium]|jgi:hypothetical protein